MTDPKPYTPAAPKPAHGPPLPVVYGEERAIQVPAIMFVCPKCNATSATILDNPQAYAALKSDPNAKLDARCKCGQAMVVKLSPLALPGMPRALPGSAAKPGPGLPGKIVLK